MMAALLVGRERLLRGIYVREVHAPVKAVMVNVFKKVTIAVVR